MVIGRLEEQKWGWSAKDDSQNSPVDEPTGV